MNKITNCHFLPDIGICAPEPQPQGNSGLLGSGGLGSIISVPSSIISGLGGILGGASGGNLGGNLGVGSILGASDTGGLVAL
jgi:hypothetical protein